MPPEVIVALIAMPPAVIIAIAQLRTSRSVGRKNGHGTVQESLAALHEKMVLDDIDRAHGENRQRDLLARLTELCAAIEVVRQDVQNNTSKIDSHMLEDVEHLARLDQAVEGIQTLIGEPGPNHTNQPLIPYVHDVIHRLGNTMTVQDGVPKAQMQVLQRALETLKKYEAAMKKREIQEQQNG